MAALAPDIRTRVERDFPEGGSDLLVRLAGWRDTHGFSDRVVRCVLHLAAGDRAKLDYHMRRAEQDWRDVIYWAEYDADDNHVFDFRLPFDPGCDSA